MKRVTGDTPDHYTFATDLAVRITDLNYGNHVGHDTLLSLLHETRVQWLAAHQVSEVDIGGCGLIMMDTQIVFANEVFYPATLRCELAVDGVTRSRFDIHYRITRIADKALIAEAKTGMACFDYTRRRPARMPDAFRTIVAPS